MQQEGILQIVYPTSKEKPDERIYIMKTGFNVKRPDLLMFQELFDKKYKRFCEETKNDAPIENGKGVVQQQHNKKGVNVVNTWIFPNGLPQEKKSK